MQSRSALPLQPTNVSGLEVLANGVLGCRFISKSIGKKFLVGLDPSNAVKRPLAQGEVIYVWRRRPPRAVVVLQDAIGVAAVTRARRLSPERSSLSIWPWMTTPVFGISTGRDGSQAGRRDAILVRADQEGNFRPQGGIAGTRTTADRARSHGRAC